MAGRTLARILVAAVLIGGPEWARAQPPARGAANDAPATYYCPMHPDVTATAPGICSRCTMALVPGDPLDLREYRVEVETQPRAVLPGRPIHVQFRVGHPSTGEIVREFATVHERRFHLFVLSHDLEFYDHVHPEQQDDGSWAIELTLPKAGYYKLYADFLPIGGSPQVIPELLVTAGFEGTLDSARARLVPDRVLRRTAGSMTVSLTVPSDGLVAGREEKLQYHVVDASSGAPVADVEPYLGAFGHTLVMSEDTLHYVHAHPVELVPDVASPRGGPDLTFKALMPKPGRYRLWTQLKRAGVVATVSFTVEVASPAAR